MRRQPAAETSAAGTWLLRLVGGLLIATALAVSLSRAPDRPPESLVARWAAPPSQFIELAGQVVHLRDEGDPRDALPVLMLHDIGSSLHTWGPWAARLARERRVIGVDLPGAGLTGPHPEADYRVLTQARFVLALMDTMKLDRVQLVGNGRGGEVALQVAALAQQRVERLLLLNPTGLAWTARQEPPAFLAARLPVVHRLIEELLPRALVQANLDAMLARPGQVTAQQVDRSFELLLREGNRRALHEQLLQMRADAAQDDGSARQRWNGLRLPTRILWGQRDRWLPADLAERLVASIPNATLLHLPAAGHLPQEDDVPGALEAALAFLTK